MVTKGDVVLWFFICCAFFGVGLMFAQEFSEEAVGFTVESNQVNGTVNGIEKHHNLIDKKTKCDVGVGFTGEIHYTALFGNFTEKGNMYCITTVNQSECDEMRENDKITLNINDCNKFVKGLTEIKRLD